MTEPREYTEAEISQQLIEHVWHLIDYWGKSVSTEREKMVGLASSILAVLDGGFIVAPSTSRVDKQYNIKFKENWYPQNHDSNVKCDISGGLSFLFHHLGTGARK